MAFLDATPENEELGSGTVVLDWDSGDPERPDIFCNSLKPVGSSSVVAACGVAWDSEGETICRYEVWLFDAREKAALRRVASFEGAPGQPYLSALLLLRPTAFADRLAVWWREGVLSAAGGLVADAYVPPPLPAGAAGPASATKKKKKTTKKRMHRNKDQNGKDGFAWGQSLGG